MERRKQMSIKEKQTSMIKHNSTIHMILKWGEYTTRHKNRDQRNQVLKTMIYFTILTEHLPRGNCFLMKKFQREHL